jgi:two-component system, OmpR family, sensor kinase
MAVVLVTTGGLLYVRERTALSASIDDDLQSRAELIAGGLDARGHGLAAMPTRFLDPDEEFAQVLDRSGQVVDSSVRFTRTPIVGARALPKGGESGYASRAVPRLGASQLVIVPIRRGGVRLFLLVGESTAETQGALTNLFRILLVVVPVGILATTFIGWLLAGLALRPVERMRREADGISKGDLGRRLPVPSTGDELARLAVTMNAMLDRVESAVDHERRLVDLASHELRTPLSVARAEVDLALARPREREELENGLRAVGEELDWMTRLSDDLLVLARADQGSMPLRPVSLPLGAILGECVTRYLERAHAGGVELRVAVGDDIAPVDADQVRQAIGNLLDNSLRHTAAGGWVSLGAEVDGEHVRFAVEDSGEGFADDVLDHAFEPFTTSHDGDRQGTGLGLAIVRAVARAHGGSAVAENVPGGGARVAMVLPRAGVEADDLGT